MAWIFTGLNNTPGFQFTFDKWRLSKMKPYWQTVKSMVANSRLYIYHTTLLGYSLYGRQYPLGNTWSIRKVMQTVVESRLGNTWPSCNVFHSMVATQVAGSARLVPKAYRDRVSNRKIQLDRYSHIIDNRKMGYIGLN